MAVSVDLVDSWPTEIVSVLDEARSYVAPSASNALDIALPLTVDSAFRHALNGAKVRAYHMTRLLPHEIDTIENEGLVPLARSLVVDRVEAAEVYGHLSSEEAEMLRRQSMYLSGGDMSNREGLTWFFLSESVLDREVHAIASLGENWGGEAIYFGLDSPELIRRVKSLGVPAVVVVALNLSERAAYENPSIPTSFLARYVGMNDYDSVIGYSDGVPSPQILEILAPGSEGYDRHADLPVD